MYISLFVLFFCIYNYNMFMYKDIYATLIQVVIYSPVDL